MTERLARLAWTLRHRPAVLVWAALALWLPAFFRLFARTDIGAAGLLDDLGTAALTISIWPLLVRLPGRARAFGIGAAGLVLGGLHVGALLYFRFFSAFVPCRLVATAATAVDARAPQVVLGLLTPAIAALGIVLPLALAALAGVLAARSARPRIGPVGGAMLAAAALLFSARAVAADGFFVAAQRNPLADFARCSLAALAAPERDFAARKREILATREATYDLSPSERFADRADFPLLRLPAPGAAREPALAAGANLVVVLLESFRAAETGLSGGGAVLTPTLHALAGEGMRFPNVYANGVVSEHGRLAAFCGVLPVPALGVVFAERPALSVRCLPEALAAAGYETHWTIAYDTRFTGMGPFFRAHGVERVFEEADVRARGLRHAEIGWGPADEDLFDATLDVLDRARPPFYAQVFTLSGHFPWQADSFPPLPPGYRLGAADPDYEAYLRALHYTDRAVGRFVAAARRRPWFANTVFAFLGDHGVWVFPHEDGGVPLGPLDRFERYFRGGMIVWAPGRVPARSVRAVGSQIDVAPTLLDALGVATPNAFQGTSLLSELPAERRIAMMMGDNGFGVREGDRYCYPLGQSCFAGGSPGCPAGVEPEAADHACFETGEDLLEAGAGRRARLLDETERRVVLGRAERIIEAATVLTETDAWMPAEARAAAAGVTRSPAP